MSHSEARRAGAYSNSIEILDFRGRAPSCSKTVGTENVPIASAATLASAAFRRGILDGQAAITAANKAAKSTMTARTIAECAGLNGPGIDAKRARAGN